MTVETPEAKMWEMIDHIRIAMMTTRNGEQLQSRPMNAYVDRDHKKVYFITPLDTEKAHEIGAGDPVNLAFVDRSTETYVSVEGHARVMRDEGLQKKLWNAYAEAWLPQGPNAPDVGLIEVTPSEATYWNSPSSKLVQLWKVGVANVLQSPPKNEVEHISL